MSTYKEWDDVKLPEKIAKQIKGGPAQRKNVEERFRNMQVNPGEAIGVIAAQSIGEPGTQMSLKFDEKVLVSYKDVIKTIKIGEFVDKIIESQNTKRENDVEIYDLPKNNKIKVLSLDNKEKLVWKELKAISRHKNEEELLKLKLRSGRDITATRSHSFVIRKDNKIIPIAGAGLNLGDRIPTMRALAVKNELSSINVSTFTYGIKRKLPEVLQLTEQLGWIFGAYLAEGNATANFVNISNNSEIFMQQIQNFSQDFDLTMNVYHHSRGFSDSTDIRINSTMLSRLLKTYCSTGSYNKKIPHFSINANKRFLSGLLRAYFDGDGNISIDRKVIRTYSKSKELIEGIALLLNRFGIFSRKSMNKEGYALSISYRYADIFLKEIGLDIPNKLEKLKALAESSKKDMQQYNITEMYTGFSDVIYKLAKKLNYPLRSVNNFTKRQKIGRSTLNKYIQLFSKLAKENNINIRTELNILKQMYTSDVVWDEIIGLEYVTDKHGYLYDFSVDGLETFTTAEGIVTHNTMRTFHFAGVAELNVTLGLPRIIEVLDARKEPKTPMMKIYLNAPYNKTFASADKIANKIRQVSLENVADEFVSDLVNFKLIIKLNTQLCKKHGISPKEIAANLKTQLKGADTKCSGNNIEIASVKDIKKLYKLKEKIRSLYVSGVKSISHALAVRKGDEYMIQTYGSNIKDIQPVAEIDENRVTTNHFYEIFKTYGIEAVRNLIVDEINMILDQEGLDVDVRHIMLIADTMCKSGELLGITRHGITSEKQSVLARASFEIPLKHLVEASVIGEEDQLTSVVENIMINQPVPIGTGLPDLVVKMKQSKSFAASSSKTQMKGGKSLKPKSVKKKTAVKPKATKKIATKAKKVAAKPKKKPAKKKVKK